MWHEISKCISQKEKNYKKDIFVNWERRKKVKKNKNKINGNKRLKEKAWKNGPESLNKSKGKKKRRLEQVKSKYKKIQRNKE